MTFKLEKKNNEAQNRNDKTDPISLLWILTGIGWLMFLSSDNYTKVH